VVFVTPRPLHAVLGELAGRIGNASVVDEKAADDLAFFVEGQRHALDELDKRVRRLKGEAAQHLEDEEQLGRIVRALLVKRPDRERFRRKRGPERERLMPRERHKLERALLDRPGAGRRTLALATGVSEWKARRFLEERASLQPGEVSGRASQVAGEDASDRERRS
jgi:hypothetical protein